MNKVEKTNKFLKITTMLLVAVVMIVLATTVYATEDGIIDPKEITGIRPESNAIQTMGSRIVGIIQTVGSVVAVVILLVLGIKYMMGSAEEKAEYKKSMIPYLVGAVLIFAASNIASIIFGFAQSLNAE